MTGFSWNPLPLHAVPRSLHTVSLPGLLILHGGSGLQETIPKISSPLKSLVQGNFCQFLLPLALSIELILAQIPRKEKETHVSMGRVSTNLYPSLVNHNRFLYFKYFQYQKLGWSGGSFSEYIWHFLQVRPYSKLLKIELRFILIGISKLFSKKSVPVYLPTKSVWIYSPHFLVVLKHIYKLTLLLPKDGI